MYKKWLLGYLLLQNCQSQLIYQDCIPGFHVFVSRKDIFPYLFRDGYSNDLNKMTNPHCCHCLVARQFFSYLFSWFLIKLWQFNIQCLTKRKLTIYFKHIITIILLEKADFLGWRKILLCSMKWLNLINFPCCCMY